MRSTLVYDSVCIGSKGCVVCTGRGTCSQGRCTCEEGFSGTSCEVNGTSAVSCPQGVVDSAGECCETGVIDVAGKCCGADMHLDGIGLCCDAPLDACGVCGGDGKFIDLAGACCSVGACGQERNKQLRGGRGRESCEHDCHVDIWLWENCLNPFPWF